MPDAESVATPLTRDRTKELRRAQTPQETVLWQALRSRRAGGVKFRRQHPVGPFVVDFFCMEAFLAVELDGWVHEDDERRAADERRTRWLHRHADIEVIRFSNEEVVLDVERVCDVIQREALRLIAARRSEPRVDATQTAR